MPKCCSVTSTNQLSNIVYNKKVGHCQLWLITATWFANTSTCCLRTRCCFQCTMSSLTTVDLD